MKNPVRHILDRCHTGFTVGQKCRLSLFAGLYLVMPLDLIPDPLIGFGQLDDIGVLVLLVKVLLSPTLRVKRANVAGRGEVVADVRVRPEGDAR